MPMTSGEIPWNYFPQDPPGILITIQGWEKKAAFAPDAELKEDSALTSFEVQEKPAVAEVKVGVISILVHQLKQFRIQDLHKEKVAKG